jgi:competence protein ComEC
MNKVRIFCVVFYLVSCWAAIAQQNGKLQIHFMDVGQGDGAVMISPKGEIVMFDSGLGGHSDLPISYLQQLGVDHVDYHITSHYHNDHMGCVPEVLSEFPLRKFAYDRGGSYNSSQFDRYVRTVGDKRKQAVDGTSLVLDRGSNAPVRIDFVASNGNGVETDNENDMSLVSVVHFGKFDAVFGGDLSGMDANQYADIETSVGPKVGEVEVYKVNHHGSRYSSNEVWLKAIHPKIGIISCGDGNSYRHPTAACLTRLHASDVQCVYWTERGNGAQPHPPQDKVGGNILIEVEPGSTKFKVIYAGQQVDEYDDWDTPASGPAANPLGAANAITNGFSWSKASRVYHDSSCPFVKNISPWNLETGNTAPEGKQPHSCLK